jgi:hypothetical protein
MREMSLHFTRGGRRKTRWSLSTEQEQITVWGLERQILHQFGPTHATQIIVLQWEKRPSKTIVEPWKESA